MKKSKQANASELEDGVDRISNLPDPVLHIILSRLLSTEEVIRMSILSTRWRYLWTSVPSLDIDFSRGLKPSKELRRKKFEEFVRYVFAKRSLDLESFRLCCSDYYNMPTVRRFIRGAVTRNVKLLDLMFCLIEESEVIMLPRILVKCGSLEGLRLFLFGRRLRFPNITGFPSLRVLELNNVKLDDNLVKSFLKSCPLLEDLSLKDCMLKELYTLCIECPNLKNLYIDCISGIPGIDFEEVEGWHYGPDRVRISCPKLVFMELTGYIAYDRYDRIFESLDSLKKVVIHSEVLDEEYIDSDICEWFVGISHVESLSLSLQFIILCFFGVDWSEERIPKPLPNLKTLELSIGSGGVNSETADKLFEILLCFPNLESLHLIFQKQASWSCGWKLDLYEAEKRRLLTRHLKRVEFLKSSGGNEELVVVRSLLEHGNVLERMVFGWVNKAVYHEKSIKTLEKVSTFHKASSTVKLVTLLNK